MSLRLTQRLSLMAAFSLALMAAPSLARAGDDDVPFDTKIMRSIMGGLGLQRGDEPQINYQERSPLVLPPGSELPPPARSNAAIAANPAWPKDPDIARAKAQADMERTRDVEAEIELEQSRHMTQEQMAPGARTNPALARRTSTKTVNSSTGENRMLPSELGFKGSIFGAMFDAKDDRDVTRFTAEPPRASLTDPPAGYRVPSPAEPYGSGKTLSAPRATDSYSTHGEVNSGNN
jgi:hypothetical protein